MGRFCSCFAQHLYGKTKTSLIRCLEAAATQNHTRRTWYVYECNANNVPPRFAPEPPTAAGGPRWLNGNTLNHGGPGFFFFCRFSVFTETPLERVTSSKQHGTTKHNKTAPAKTRGSARWRAKVKGPVTVDGGTRLGDTAETERRMTGC